MIYLSNIGEDDFYKSHLVTLCPPFYNIGRSYKELFFNINTSFLVLEKYKGCYFMWRSDTLFLYNKRYRVEISHEHSIKKWPDFNGVMELGPIEQQSVHQTTSFNAIANRDYTCCPNFGIWDLTGGNTRTNKFVHLILKSYNGQNRIK